MKSIAKKLIKTAKKEKIHIVIRFQKFKSRSLTVKNLKVDNSDLLQKEGTGIHAFTKSGNMGFSSVDTIEDESRLINCLKKSIQLAKISEQNSFEKIKEIFDLKKIIDSKTQKAPVDPFKIKISEFESDLKKINRRIKEKYPNFSATSIAKFYKNHLHTFRSDGTDVAFTAMNSNLYSFLTINKDGNINQMFNSTHSFGYELISEAKKINYHYKLLDNYMQYIKKLYKAKNLKPGNYTLLLDNSIAGVFAHEALGHLSEADHYYTESPLLKNGRVKKGEKVAPNYVNIFDEANIKDRGFYPYDSWGVKRKRVDIIKKGKIKDLISDVITYKKTGCNLKGGAKAQFYSDIPCPRMSCTQINIDKKKTVKLNFDPLTSKVEKVYKVLLKNKLFKQYKEIIYLVGSNGGMVDSERGNFQFASVLSFKLTRDKIQLLKQVSFSGITMEVLKSIKLAFGKPRFFPGFCLKNSQAIIESMSSPLILIDKNKYITVG